MRSARVLAVAAVLAGAWDVGLAAAGEVKIGVVNVREILARYRKSEDLQKQSMERMRGRRDELEKRRKDLARRVAEAQADLPANDQDPARIRTVKEIETQEFLLKLDFRELQREMQRTSDSVTAFVLEEIAAACRRIGEAQGFYMILKQYGPNPGATEPRERVEAFQLDPVLYCAPEADLTGRVLDLLEDAYRKGIKLVPGDPIEDAAGGKGAKDAKDAKDTRE